MMKDITHKYLRKEMMDFDHSDDLDGFLAELEYSTLIGPKLYFHGFSKMEYAELDFVPLFTDFHEYEKHEHPKDAFPQSNEFSFYLDFLSNEDIEGFIINPESEQFFIGSEFFEIMMPNHAFDNKGKRPTSDEMIKIRQSIDNASLKEYLKGTVFINLHELMDKLTETDSLTLLKSKDPIKTEIDIMPRERTPLYVHRLRRDRYALIFTGDEEINVSSRDGYFCQLVDMPFLMKHVLNSDLEGIILNPNSDNIKISRDAIRHWMKDFSSPPDVDFTEYMFQI